MNWLFGAYSNLYKTAMLQSNDKSGRNATAKQNLQRSVSLGAFMGRRWVD